MTNSFLDGAVFIDVAFVAALAVGVSASIHRIGEDVVECSVGRRDPADLAGCRRCRLQREGQAFGAEPEPDAARRAEFGETLEDRADGASDGFVGMEQNFAILFSPNEADRQSAAQFAASGFVADAAVEPGANDVQFGFAHRTLEAEQQTIVEQRRMIDAIVVANESVGEAAEFEQAIPVGVVPRQARDFQTENDSHMGQRDFAGQASEPGSIVGAGAGEPEIFVDDDDLLLRPAELTGFLSQGVLSRGGFAVVFDLGQSRLANVDQGCALRMGQFDFGRISHWSAPSVVGSGCFDEEARQSLDDDLFLVLVELFPQVRLRNGDVGEVQIQLRHGSPGLRQMLPAGRSKRQSGVGEHLREIGGEASPPASRPVVGHQSEEPRWPGSLSSRRDQRLTSVWQDEHELQATLSHARA